MHIVHITGRSKNGKTTLIVDLIEEMKHRGLKVGTLKHSGHAHELDKPGKDSYRHRQAGAVPVAISTTSQLAVFLPYEPSENPFERLTALFADCDVILVEGFIDGPGKKIEVWRAEVGKEPLFMERPEVLAVVTDDPIETTLPVMPRADIPALVDFLMDLKN